MRIVATAIERAPILLIAGLLAISPLSHLNAASPEDLVRELTQGNPHKAGDAARELLKTPSAAVPALTAGLKDPKPDARKICLRLLGRIDTPESREAVLKSMSSDSDWVVRHEAIWAVKGTKAADVQAALTRVSRHDAHAMNRAAAVRVLSFLLGERSLPAIKENLEDKDALVALAAAKELGRYGDASGVKIAEAHLDDADWRIKAAAAEAMSTTGDQKHLARLRKLAEGAGENQQVQVQAEQAIQAITFKGLPESDRLSHLKQALRSEKWAVRSWAAAELSRRKDADSDQVLEAAAADPKHPAREEASQGLHSRRELRSVP